MSIARTVVVRALADYVSTLNFPYLGWLNLPGWALPARPTIFSDEDKLEIARYVLLGQGTIRNQILNWEYLLNPPCTIELSLYLFWPEAILPILIKSIQSQLKKITLLLSTKRSRAFLGQGHPLIIMLA